jgi:hypothetical protein
MDGVFEIGHEERIGLRTLIDADREDIGQVLYDSARNFQRSVKWMIVVVIVIVFGTERSPWDLWGSKEPLMRASTGST